MEQAERTSVTQYLTFNVGEELFAVDVGQVREVLELSAITRIPNSPPFMRGVINVRGSVVPVVDMRRKFGLPPVEHTVETCIVVMEVELEGEQVVLGALVDAVEEVIELEPKDVERAPRIGTQLDTEFIRGMGKLEEKFIIILDINRVFTGEELAQIRQTEA